jgi:outer membrane protein OmpA-like peptidoglycan-associated protein
MKTAWLAVALTSLALAFPVAAQTPEKVLSGADITEAALIEALTPAPAAEPPIVTRSIRVESSDAPRPPAAKPASASLLITFETNSASLTSRAKQALNVVSEALRSNKLAAFRFAIQGHADPRGNPEANLKLSQLRAESVRDYLVQNKHIEDQRLEAIGKGDSELMNTANPIAPENRRVTIVNLAQ